MWIGSENGIFSCYLNKVEKEEELNQQMDNSTIMPSCKTNLAEFG